MIDQIECPACAGPEEGRLTCSTCEGKMTVEKEVYDNFMLKKDALTNLNAFMLRIRGIRPRPTDTLVFTINDQTFRYENGALFED
jgi:hypothetical protein